MWSFLKYLPSIKSPLTLIGLALLLVVAIIYLFLKSPLVKLLEKKFSRPQAYKAFIYILFGLFILALGILGVAYLKTLLDYNNESRNQTTITINNNEYEILKITPSKTDSVNLFISNSPPFALPLGRKSVWLPPIDIKSSKTNTLFNLGDMKDFLEAIDSTPFFQQLNNCSGYIIPAKLTVNTVYDSKTSIQVHDFFEGSKTVQPFSDRPLRQSTRSHVVILISQPMNNETLKKFNFSDYCASFISNLIVNPKQLIITKSRMHAQVEAKLSGAIVNNQRTDITVSKYYTLLQSNNRIYFLEGVYFSSDDDPIKEVEISNSVFHFSAGSES